MNNNTPTRHCDQRPTMDYDVCGQCGALFDDQGENGWWMERGAWWHECDGEHPARVVVRKLARVA